MAEMQLPDLLPHCPICGAEVATVDVIPVNGYPARAYPCGHDVKVQRTSQDTTLAAAG